MLGAGSASATPFTTRFATLDPSALLLLTVLLAIATMPSALIRPPRICTFPSVALLIASEDVPSTLPLAMANASWAVTNVATLTSPA